MEATVICLGGGVQSSALYVMAARGDMPRVDFAVFADTGAEKSATYGWLWRLAREYGARLPIVVGSHGNLYEDVLASARTQAGSVKNPPFFTSPDGMLRQKCTQEYKARVIDRTIKRRLRVGRVAPRGLMVHRFIGISVDEVGRMKPSNVGWSTFHYPLIDARLRRSDCESYLLATIGETPPKSCCVMCPYQSGPSWRRLRDFAPEDFARAELLDSAIRDGIGGTKEKLYLNRGRVPLAVAVANDNQGDLFGNDCGGYCGV